jgi:hypothetical protein
MLLLGACCPPTNHNNRQQLFERQQQSEATSISSTYPLMRAARLLEDWAPAGHTQLQPDQDHSASSPSKRRGAPIRNGHANNNGTTRPWPCFDPSKPHHQQQQQHQQQQLGAGLDVGHALPRPAAEWTPAQRSTAAAAAEAWVAELARGQALLAAALQRAEAAEMELAAVKLDGVGGRTGCGVHTGGAAGGGADRLLYLAAPPSAGGGVGDGFDSCGVAGSGGSSSSPRRQLGSRQQSAIAGGGAAAAAVGSGVCDDELRRQLLEAQQELMAARAELRAAR